jgi:hypothetical protein
MFYDTEPGKNKKNPFPEKNVFVKKKKKIILKMMEVIPANAVSNNNH